MDRVTVLGGTGFVGDYLINTLSRNKRIKIKALYRKTPPLKKIAGVKYLKIDGAEDFIDFKRILKETDYLVILSRPNKNLIENVIKTGLKFKKILYASTLLIYPDSESKQDENSDLEPANEYEQDKIVEENLLSKFAKDSGNMLTIARLTNIYGDVKNRALVHWILSAAVNGTAFKLNNSGMPVRDFIFVEDVASCINKLLFINQENNVEIFNVCTGLGFSINHVVKEVEKVAGKKLNIQQGELTQEKLCVIGDNSKIVKATGFKPEYDLESGLKLAYKNYLKN